MRFFMIWVQAVVKFYLQPHCVTHLSNVNKEISRQRHLIFVVSLWDFYPVEKTSRIKVWRNLDRSILNHKRRLYQTYNWALQWKFRESILNFIEMNWSDGTVIFVSSTCYTREVMNKIEFLCDKLPPGTILITLTRSI
jgi:hypothetical protein